MTLLTEVLEYTDFLQNSRYCQDFSFFLTIPSILHCEPIYPVGAGRSIAKTTTVYPVWFKYFFPYSGSIADPKSSGDLWHDRNLGTTCPALSMCEAPHILSLYAII